MKDFYNTKAYVLCRDSHKCQNKKCKGKTERLEVHHKVFRSKGGTDSPDNLITLCADCHAALHKGEWELNGSASKTKHATEIGIVSSQVAKRFGNYQETFGYETKYKREQILGFPKEHYYDAVAIACVESETVEPLQWVLRKRGVSKGDYQQTKGPRSEKRIPTGKLFGLRKFDLIETFKGTGFVKGKRSSGFFSICDFEGKTIHASVNVKKDCRRLSARQGNIITKEEAALSSHD